jgi:pilus assembly protein CpaB
LIQTGRKTMRRTFGIVTGLGVAAFGTLLLVGYVRAAEDRALEGEEVVEVLVIDVPVAKGTPASVLDGSVRLERVPVKVAAEGTVTDLTTLGELVASTDLLPGEQLTAARFVAAETLSARAAVEPPPGTISVTIAIAPDRALGGAILPGDVVAVIASFEPFDLNTVEPSELAPGQVINPEEIFLGSSDGEGGTSVKTPYSTSIILHKVFVTNVQVEQLPRTDETAPEGAPELAPTGNLLVTLAAAPEDAERIIFTAEHGAIWLGAVSEDTPEPITPVRTRENIYR